MKKKWCIAAISTLALCGGIAIAIPSLQPPGPGVTKANFDRIEKGMQKEQVDAIFGGRPRLISAEGNVHCACWEYLWEAEDGARGMVIFIGESVDDKHWTPSTETITEKLRRWLHLPRN